MEENTVTGKKQPGFFHENTQLAYLKYCLSFWFLGKLISLPGRGDAILSVSMWATAMILAVPSPLWVAGHPFSSVQEAGTAGGTWSTSPLCVLLDCTSCTAKKPKAGGERDLQQERKDEGKVAPLA